MLLTNWDAMSLLKSAMSRRSMSSWDKILSEFGNRATEPRAACWWLCARSLLVIELEIIPSSLRNHQRKNNTSNSNAFYDWMIPMLLPTSSGVCVFLPLVALISLPYLTSCLDTLSNLPCWSVSCFLPASNRPSDSPTCGIRELVIWWNKVVIN